MAFARETCRRKQMPTRFITVNRTVDGYRVYSHHRAVNRGRQIRTYEKIDFLTVDLQALYENRHNQPIMDRIVLIQVHQAMEQLQRLDVGGMHIISQLEAKVAVAKAKE